MVSDERALAALKDKRKHWLDWLSGDDPHSIRNQISSMIWYAAAFRIVNAARRYAPVDAEGRVQLNDMMHDLINEGFFHSQAMAIRRLFDTRARVWSLDRLLDDMQKNGNLLTRENMLAAEELPYDGEPVKAELDKYCREHRGDGARLGYYPSRLDYHWIETRHKAIDRLCGVSAASRNRHDTVRKSLFTRLKRRREKYAQVLGWVRTQIAHAALPQAREAMEKQGGVNLQLLWDAHKAICGVVCVLAIAVLGDSCAPPLAYPQYDHLQYLDRPLVGPDQMGVLADEWALYQKETESWNQLELDDFLRGADGTGEQEQQS
ncbi:MAG: hypothetical protein NT031_11765 [Planctomycetota bacterium]|nr:hypothetical protein [Planctomycetota bacterium]